MDKQTEKVYDAVKARHELNMADLLGKKRTEVHYALKKLGQGIRNR